MTKETLDRIVAMHEGRQMSYSQISAETGINVNTIKHAMATHYANVKKPEDRFCRYCGKKIWAGSLKRAFCNPKCRNRWHYEHPNPHVRYARMVVCETCKKEFWAYRKDKRKYCSEACYVRGRYGRELLRSSALQKDGVSDKTQ